MRSGKIERNTSETRVSVAVDLDGAGNAHISTGVGFFDHMLDQIARHAPLDLELTAKGDLHIDAHHTVEDVGIAFGQAVDRGARRPQGHHPLWRRACAARRGVDPRRRGYFRSALSRLRGQISGAKNRRFRHRADSRIFPGRRGACADRAAHRELCAASTVTISPKARSKVSRALSARPRRSTRARKTRCLRPRAR